MQTAKQYVEYIKNLGFEEVLVDILTDKRGAEVPYRLFARTDGFLLEVEEFRWEHDSDNVINVAQLHYNWKRFAECRDWFHYTSSGHYTGPNGESLPGRDDIPSSEFVWVGYHTFTRFEKELEGTIRNFKENGELLPQWVECTFPWLTHYSEMATGHDYSKERFESYYEITRERIKRLPEWVQQMIGSYKE